MGLSQQVIRHFEILYTALECEGYRLNLSTPDLYDTCIKLASENISKDVIKDYLIKHTDKEECNFDEKQELDVMQLLHEFSEDALLSPILRKLGS